MTELSLVIHKSYVLICGQICLGISKSDGSVTRSEVFCFNQIADSLFHSGIPAFCDEAISYPRELAYRHFAVFDLALTTSTPVFAADVGLPAVPLTLRKLDV